MCEAPSKERVQEKNTPEEDVFDETSCPKDTPATFTVAQLKWHNIVYIGLMHIGAVYALIRFSDSVGVRDLLVLWLLLWFLSGLGITAGAHRLWAHKSYKAALPLRVFLMLMNSMAFQGSIFDWSRDHRVHHKGSETNSDPHNANRGFFFAHMGWLFVKKHPHVVREGKKINLSDLLEDVTVSTQRRHYLLSVFLMCYLFPTALGHYFCDSASKGFWIGGVFRHVWVLHMTWLVNSAAHFWGYRPYSPGINPAENLLVSICAIGEGWHNYHHKFPTDYATGEWGIMSGQWNPTKLFIDACALVGLAYDLKRSKTAPEIRRRIAEEHRKHL